MSSKIPLPVLNILMPSTKYMHNQTWFPVDRFCWNLMYNKTVAHFLNEAGKILLLNFTKSIS